MSIKVNKTVRSRISSDPGGILLQVRGAELAAAATALEQARSEIARLDGGWESAPGLRPGDTNGPKYLSGVVETPSGPLLYIDGGHTPEELLATIPEIVVRRLQNAGVRDAVLASPMPKGPLAELATVPRAVILYAFAFPPSATGEYRPVKVPASWIDQGSDWVTAEMGVDDPLLAQAMIEFSAHKRDIGTLFELGRRSGSVTIVAGDTGSRLRGIAAAFIGSQSFALGAGGPGVSDADLLDEAKSLIGVARALSPQPAYAFLGLEPGFAMLSHFDVGTEWSRTGGASPQWIRDLSDILVLDGFPFQILGPGHLARMGGNDSAAWSRQDGIGIVRHDGANTLELSVGDLSDWLIDHPPILDGISPSWPRLGERRRDPRVQGRARQLVAPCLLSEVDARELWTARRRGGSQ